jgi:hypothetical protein
MPMDSKGMPRRGNSMKNFADGAHKEAPPMQKPEAAGGESNQPIEEVVSQHGPADKIEMQHNDAASEHHVTSHHGGFTHKSKHGSRAEAHAHAKKAAGVTDEQQQPSTDSSAPQQDVSSMM